MLIGEKYRYRWVVLVMASVTSGLTWGIAMTVGHFYSSWMSYFDAPASYVSMAGSLTLTVACAAGPIFRNVVKKLGLRWSSFCGGLIMAMGLAAGYFAQSVLAICFTFGVVTGLGSGLSNFCGCGALNEYFYKERAFAEGVVGGVFCLFSFCISVAQQYWITSYTWRGAILLTSALSLQQCIVSLFFISPNVVAQHPLNLWRETDIPHTVSKRENDKCLDEPLEIPSAAADQEQVKSDLQQQRSYLKIISSPTFLLLATIDFLNWFGHFIPYVHLVERGRIQGIDFESSAWLASAFGAGGFVGRPLTGFVCDYFKIHPFKAFCFVQFVSGVSSLISPFWPSTLGLFVYASFYGFFSSGYGLFKSGVPRMLGSANYVDALSLMLVLEAIGVVLGPTVSGIIYDQTNSYDWSFCFSGLCQILTGILSFFIPVVRRLESRRSLALNVA
ncbi:monocarboxylate transporter 1-like [Ciona intestinalis]